MTDATNNHILCAIDTADLDEAEGLAGGLAGAVGGFKLGNEFFTSFGPQGVTRLASSGHRVFLDLKFHDIPNTVAGAVTAAAALGCAMLTVHASGGSAMLRAAVEAAHETGEKRPAILAITVLTSLGDEDLFAVGQAGPVSSQVSRLGALAAECGVDGLVASPHEVEMLRRELGSDMTLVVPGVRPRWASTDDQKRVMTPAEAMVAGADYLVIGRPITRADDPKVAARRITDEMAPGDRPAG